MWIRASNAIAFALILFVLGGILFATTQRSRSSSDTLRCSQNLKMLTLAILQYEQDKGQFPPGRMFLNGSKEKRAATDMVKWTNAISPYLNSSPEALTSMGNQARTQPSGELAAHPPGDQDDYYDEPFRCPTVRNWDKAGLNMSYGYNFHYLGNADPLSYLFGKGNLGFVNFPVSKKAIYRPDRTIALADSDGTGFKEYRSAGDRAEGPDPSHIGAFAYLLDPPFLPQVKQMNVPTSPAAAGGIGIDTKGKFNVAPGGISHQAYRSIVSRRHEGQANVAFLDGHVEIMDRERAYFRWTSDQWPSPMFITNELWNGRGIDNDRNGNGKIDGSDELLDTNEAFPIKGMRQISEEITGHYNPAQKGKKSAHTNGLQGAYGNFGADFDPALFFNLEDRALQGPTLPRVKPFQTPWEPKSKKRKK